MRSLADEFPGWFFWTSETEPMWRGAPAPGGSRYADVAGRPWRVGAGNTADLRAAVRRTYGWYDICETCHKFARECPHLQRPEPPEQPPDYTQDMSALAVDNPKLLATARDDFTVEDMEYRRTYGRHTCMRCDKRAVHAFVAETNVGPRWLDLCAAHADWLIR